MSAREPAADAMHAAPAAFAALTIGQRFVSAGRTLTETDLSFSCMLSGDWHPIHADAEYCRATLGGERLLAEAEIAAERRAETLDVDAFDRLARLLAASDVSSCFRP